MKIITKDKLKVFWGYCKSGIMIVYILSTLMLIIGLLEKNPAIKPDANEVGVMLSAWFIFTLPLLLLIVGIPKDKGKSS
ncbi:hypothetical protein ACSSUQ_004246 [Yersinia enterocolitica]